MVRVALIHVRWIIAVLVVLPLLACGDKATTAPAAEAQSASADQSRSLAQLGGGSGDQASLAVPLESLKVDETAVEAKTREKRSAKEVEACVDEKARNFKGPDGQPSAPSVDDLKAWIEACGA